MEYLTTIDLAKHEKVEPPKAESSNFLYSFSLLPKEERVAINSVYAFCSYIDDIVDSKPSREASSIKLKIERLAFWEHELDLVYSGRAHGLIVPFAKVIERFKIPKQYFLTLIDGCKQDLSKYRYGTFEELKDYCYSVASVVGLISIEIFGYKYEETKEYAVNLGYALQLTNIIRDIKTDKDRGYIYLPKEDMDRFGVSEDDLINENYDQNFIDMLSFQTKRAREYYHLARKSLRPDERPSIVAAEVMDAIYYRLLEKIELNEFNVFSHKIKVSNLHKIMIAFKHWLSIKMFIRRIKKQP